MSIFYHFSLLMILIVVFGAAAYHLLLAISQPVWQLRLRQGFITRFSWLVGLLPILLWIASQVSAPEVLANLFVLSGWYQFSLVAFLSLLLAALTLITSDVALTNAPARFEGYRALLPATFPGRPKQPGERVWSGRRWLLLFL